MEKLDIETESGDPGGYNVSQAVWLRTPAGMGVMGDRSKKNVFHAFLSITSHIFVCFKKVFLLPEHAFVSSKHCVWE